MSEKRKISSLDIICSLKLTVFLELCSHEIVRILEQIMSVDKYTYIYSREMEAIVYISGYYRLTLRPLMGCKCEIKIAVMKWVAELASKFTVPATNYLNTTEYKIGDFPVWNSFRC